MSGKEEGRAFNRQEFQRGGRGEQGRKHRECLTFSVWPTSSEKPFTVAAPGVTPMWPQGEEPPPDLGADSQRSPVCAAGPCSAETPEASEKRAASLCAWIRSSLSPADSSSEDSLQRRQRETRGTRLPVAPGLHGNRHRLTWPCPWLRRRGTPRCLPCRLLWKAPSPRGQTWRRARSPSLKQRSGAAVVRRSQNAHTRARPCSFSPVPPFSQHRAT